MELNKELVSNLYWDKSMSLNKIAKHTEHSVSSVFRFMRTERIPTRSRRPVVVASTDHLDIMEVIKKYLDGVGCPTLAKEYGVSTGSMYYFLNKNGVKIRTLKKACSMLRGKYKGNSAKKKRIDNQGYIRVRAFSLSESEQELFEPMFHHRAAGTPEVLEHRIVMARIKGRPLKKGEVVHHLNGVKNDNRPENLVLLNPRTHKQYLSALQKRIRFLEKRIEKLEAEKQLTLELGKASNG